MFGYTTKITVLLAILACCPAAFEAQKIEDGKSFWYWRTKPDKDNLSFQFSVSLTIKGKKASGFLGSRGLENGEWNGGDGQVTPFVGRVVGDVIRIEYDNADWRNGESDDAVRPYLRPDRKTRFTAELRFRGEFVEFLQIRGRSASAYPARMLLVDADEADRDGR